MLIPCCSAHGLPGGIVQILIWYVKLSPPDQSFMCGLYTECPIQVYSLNNTMHWAGSTPHHSSPTLHTFLYCSWMATLAMFLYQFQIYQSFNHSFWIRMSSTIWIRLIWNPCKFLKCNILHRFSFAHHELSSLSSQVLEKFLVFHFMSQSDSWL